jgi:hypothetical protein
VTLQWCAFNLLAKQLDDWRRKKDDLLGRPEAIRRLVELGLKAKG